MAESYLEIEASLRQFLLTRAAVVLLVDAGDDARIRVDRLHARDFLPAIVIEVDSEEPQNDLSGKGGLVISQVNIGCRATSRKESRQLAEAIRTNNTDPGTGLAGYSGPAGDQTIDAVLDDEQTAHVPANDGGDTEYYVVNQSYTITYSETV